MSPSLYLASQSPRRRELLSQIGVLYDVISVSVPEQHESGEPPEDYVSRLAASKSSAGWEASRRDAPVLGADTIVVADERILEKPRDREEAIAMLLELSGREHRVLTAVAVTSNQGQSGVISQSKVHFRDISREEAERYWDSGEPEDKAGGYAIQGFGAVFVASLQGSYSGVVGLPLMETQAILAEHGVAVWNRPTIN